MTQAQTGGVAVAVPRRKKIIDMSSTELLAYQKEQKQKEADRVAIRKKMTKPASQCTPEELAERKQIRLAKLAAKGFRCVVFLPIEHATVLQKLAADGNERPAATARRMLMNRLLPKE